MTLKEKIKQGLPVYGWWPTQPKPGNFGDILTPWLYTKITKKSVLSYTTSIEQNTLLAVGSIVHRANSGTIVWGSGLMGLNRPIKSDVIYTAVRGPLTRQHIINSGYECPEIYGDPALLLPHFYKPKKVSKKYKLGIFGHYVDTEFLRSIYADKNNKTYTIIDPLNVDITKIVDRMSECESIVSSSLHGIIAAHTYGIPSAWVKFSDKLDGDGTKFNDHYMSVGLQPRSFILCTENTTINELLDMPKYEKINIDLQSLMNACPFNIHNIILS